jgi:hypothetical protein
MEGVSGNIVRAETGRTTSARMKAAAFRTRCWERLKNGLSDIISLSALGDGLRYAGQDGRVRPFTTLDRDDSHLS